MKEAKTPKPPVVINAKETKESKTIPEKLREFIIKTGAVYTQNEGTPFEKHYATAQAWSYLAHLNHCHVEIERVWQENDYNDRNATVVLASGCLIDDSKELPDEQDYVITKATMCATTNEKFLQDKPLAAAYGLAQTRLEERLLRMKFGYQLSLAQLEPIGAEELDLDSVKYGTKDKEV